MIFESHLVLLDGFLCGVVELELGMVSFYSGIRIKTLWKCFTKSVFFYRDPYSG